MTRRWIVMDHLMKRLDIIKDCKNITVRDLPIIIGYQSSGGMVYILNDYTSVINGFTGKAWMDYIDDDWFDSGDWIKPKTRDWRWPRYINNSTLLKHLRNDMKCQHMEA